MDVVPKILIIETAIPSYVGRMEFNKDILIVENDKNIEDFSISSTPFVLSKCELENNPIAIKGGKASRRERRKQERKNT